MRRKLIVVLAIVALSAAACGGGKKDKEGSKPDSSATTAPAGGDTTTSSSAPGSNGATGSLSGAGAGAGAAAGAGGATTTTAGNANTTTTARPTAVTRTAAAGRYTYRRTGTQTSPAFGGDRSLDGEGTLTVDPANGNEQHSKVEYTESVNEQTLRHRPGGIDLLYLRNEIRGFSNYEFRPAQPVLFAPDPTKVGATWSWRLTSTDGRLTIDGSFKALRSESVTIGGEAVATTVVEGNLTFSGALNGTSRQTVWGSDKYRLIVRTDETTDVGFAKSQSSSVLTSTKPA